MSGKREVKVVISGDPSGSVKALKTTDGALSATAEHSKSVSSKIGGAFSKVGSQLGGEFGDVLDKIGQGFDNLGEHGKSIGKGLQVAGGAATVVGLGLQAIGSKDKQAQDQLKAAIQATGGAWVDYRDDVEKAIKSGERYGRTADDTQQAIAKITEATQDPKKAIEDMSLVENLAAAQHESLADAAGQIAKVYGGAGRVLKQYGITMDSTKQATSALTTAQRQHQAAVDQLAHAQRSLADIEEVDLDKSKLSVAQQIQLRNAKDAVAKAATGSAAQQAAAMKRLQDIEEVDRASSKLTIGQQIQLRNARDSVAAASQRVKTTTADLATAQDKAAKSTHSADDALQQLNKRLDGQASASVDNFSGHVRVVMAHLDDWTAKMGQRFGPAITAGGSVLMVAGTIVDAYQGRAIKAALAQSSLGTAAEESATRTVAADEEIVAANDGAAASAGRLKVGGFGAATGIMAVAVAAGIGGHKLSDMIEKGRAGVQVLNNLGHTTDQFTTALVNNGGKLDDQVKGLVQAQLQSSGLADKAARAGITTDQLTTAVTGNAAGMAKLIAQWRASGKPASDTIAALELLYGSYHKAAQTGYDAAAGSRAAAAELDAVRIAASKVPALKNIKVTATNLKQVEQQLWDLTQARYVDLYIRTSASGAGPGGHQPGSNAVGTEFWRGGLTTVDELGPELIDLPRGSHVRTATDSARMLAAAAAQGARQAGSAGGDERPLQITLMVGTEVLHRVLLQRRRELGGRGLGLDG